MKPEHDKLLADVLACDGDVRATALRAGLAALHRRRARRQFARAAGFLLIPIITAAVITQRTNRPAANPPPSPVARTPETIPGTSINVLTDEQLLDMFKGQPVALVGPPGNQRLLLFDETAN